MNNPMNFTSLKTTPPCLVGSGAWSSWFTNTGLPAQCHEFKCTPGHVNCCCWHVLYDQPNFRAQKLQLELIKKCSHKCDFYPKYHCELNLIEQYWGAAKWNYHMAPQAKTVRAMESTVKNCQETALTRCTSRGRSEEVVGLGPSGKQLHPATPELTAWWERLADSLQ